MFASILMSRDAVFNLCVGEHCDATPMLKGLNSNSTAEGGHD